LAAPEDWIGQQIRMGAELDPGMIEGILEEVSYRGLVLRSAPQGGEGRAPQGRGGGVPVFYPWRLVNWAHPIGELGQSSQEPPTRESPFHPSRRA
jgi:hypothetical protein